MKLLLGAILIVLGLFKLRELIETDYPFGITLALGIGFMWIIEVIREYQRNRK
jgi:uncharacterized membrane protein HdeD (DUF308 family)